MSRYGGTKLERLRDLFEQAVESAPPEFAPSLYLMYAEAEEEYGLARHAMLVPPYLFNTQYQSFGSRAVLNLDI